MSRLNRTLALLAVLLVVGARSVSAAGSITLAWDANTEPDIKGYIVQYGPTSAPFTVSVDVGNVTTWTFTSPASGTAYAFRVIAYDTSGLSSAPSAAVYGNGDATVPPSITADRSSLVFGMIAGSQPQTATQVVHLTEANGISVPWTATSNVAWLQVAPSSGNGSGAFAVSIVPSLAPASTATASISVSAPGAIDALPPIAVTLNVIAPSASQPPFGSFDTPADNTTGVTGSLAITGWALDDVGVSRVRILRDPVAGETPGQLVYIGDATLVDGARPDVATAYATYPHNYHAGWGYLALTNMLPNFGNGTFRFYAYADDADGHSTLLGTRTVTCANANATLPFGAIDTPTAGQTVSGIVTNFGWVLSAGIGNFADGRDGGTVSVLIDGTNVGSPTGWAARSDLSALFPALQFPGINAAVAVFSFDSTTLPDGVHTIAWVVTDNHGNTQGVGSRFFEVFNGTGPAPGLVAASVVAASASAESVASSSVDRAGVQARRGFDLNTPFDSYLPDANGLITIQSEEVDRVEVLTHGATDGFLHAGANARPLPVGSHLDPATGDFVWQPGPGFVGAYDLTFVNQSTGTRQDVRIVLNPRSSNRVGPQLVVDQVRPFVGGWAADLDSHSGTGISTIHVWAYPVDASGARGTPVFVGVANTGGDRPDVAAFYGEQFRNTGFGIAVTDLPAGTYDLALFPWSTARGGFLSATVVRFEVK